MAYGHISRILIRQGIGFIRADDSGAECEFHWSAVKAGSLDQLRVDMRVEFDLQSDHRDQGQTRAVNVRLVEP
jgi:cold shock CspA family protein